MEFVGSVGSVGLGRISGLGRSSILGGFIGFY